MRTCTKAQAAGTSWALCWAAATVSRRHNPVIGSGSSRSSECLPAALSQGNQQQQDATNKEASGSSAPTLQQQLRSLCIL